MPNIKSLKQLRLMQMIAHGRLSRAGLPSPAVAKEIIGPKGTRYRKLPLRAKKGRKSVTASRPTSIAR